MFVAPAEEVSFAFGVFRLDMLREEHLAGVLEDLLGEIVWVFPANRTHDLKHLTGQSTISQKAIWSVSDGCGGATKPTEVHVRT